MRELTLHEMSRITGGGCGPGCHVPGGQLPSSDGGTIGRWFRSLFGSGGGSSGGRGASGRW